MSDPSPGDLEISTDPGRLDLGFIHQFLSERSYWARGRSIETVRRSIAGSLCFGAYAGSHQIGFARVVTDGATFAWLCDVFVAESHRGEGVGKRLIETIVAHPELRGLPRFVLATRDAHALYRGHGGFDALSNPEWWMARRPRG